MKIGTIGSGFIVKTILSKVAVTEGMECAAVYSRSYETGRKLADAFGVDKVYTDLDGLCSDPELDFIYIASPNSLHYAHVKKALEHGKHVMCEKPFVPTAAEADELIAGGYIGGGMLPKLSNCTSAVKNGVNRVHILDGRIPHCLLLEIFTNHGVGTAMIADEEK